MASKTTILVGVTGSIAAYKAVDLVSKLVRAGHTLHVIMTREATELVTPLTFATISRHPVTINLFEEPAEWKPQHISLADAADLLVVAPATANVIAKLALGLADDALSSIALACQAPLLIAPAMNGKMWLHPATQKNVATLKERGAQFIGPEAGMQACGYEGLGRLWNVDDIIVEIERLLKQKKKQKA